MYIRYMSSGGTTATQNWGKRAIFRGGLKVTLILLAYICVVFVHNSRGKHMTFAAATANLSNGYDLLKQGKHEEAIASF